MSDLLLLSKRHRPSGTTWCSICKGYRRCAKLIVQADARVLLVCGSCAREISRVALEGRKERR